MMQFASRTFAGKRDGMARRMDRFGFGKGGRSSDTVCDRCMGRDNVVIDLA